MTDVEMMTWVILSLELSVVLFAIVVAQFVWGWFRGRQMRGTVAALMTQIEKQRSARTGQLTDLLGEDCPQEVLDHAVQSLLEREKALLKAITESIRSQNEADSRRVPAAVSALTETALVEGRNSVPPAEPDPELLEENADLRTELASARADLDALDAEYRAAFDKSEAAEPPPQAAKPTRPAPLDEPPLDVDALGRDLADEFASDDLSGEVINLDDDLVDAEDTDDSKQADAA